MGATVQHTRKYTVQHLNSAERENKRLARYFSAPVPYVHIQNALAFFNSQGLLCFVFENCPSRKARKINGKWKERRLAVPQKDSATKRGQITNNEHVFGLTHLVVS